MFGSVHVNPEWKIAVVRSLWHSELTAGLASAAIDALVRAGIPSGNVREITVPGAFEIPLFARIAIRELGVDGVIACGVVIQGQTAHAEVVSREAARGCMLVALETGNPVAFEVLHAHTEADARARCIGEGSKGPLAAETLLVSLARKAELQQ